MVRRDAHTLRNLRLRQLAHKFEVEHLEPHFHPDTLVSDGLHLHLDVIVKDRNAPTLVFVPGTATYALCFAEFLYLLSNEGYNVVGLDPRGHGLSEGVRGDYTISELIRDTQAAITYAIENFNENVSVVGCSQGGIVAFYVAAADDRVKSVVCQNFADLTDPRTMSASRHPFLSVFLTPIIRKAAKYFPQKQIPVTLYIDHSKLHVKHYGNLLNFLHQDPLALKSISMRALNSLTTTRLAVPIERIKTPVMVLHPENDGIFPLDYSRYLFDKLRCKKRLEIIPNTTHTLLVNHPQSAARPVLQWLNEIHKSAFLPLVEEKEGL